MSGPQMEALDFRYLLLEYYKKLNLSEVELSVILMIDHLLDQKNSLITPDLLSLKMNLSIADIDKVLVQLMEKDFVQFEIGKKMKISLKPIQKKLYVMFEKELAKENAITFDEKKAASIDALNTYFEKELNRNLSPLEVSLIKDWLNHGFKEEVIADALKECLSKGKKTLRSVDKLLYQWQKRDDIEKAGFSVSTDKWDQDIEKAMEIAKAKWIDD